MIRKKTKIELSETKEEEAARLRNALFQIATMKPSEISRGIVHGPALLLSNCQRIAKRAIRGLKA